MTPYACFLTGECPKGTRESYQLGRDRLVVGWLGDIVLHEPSVSREYATLTWNGGEWAMNTAARVAKFDANVLLFGESDTGKELFASLVMEEGTRKSKKFLPVHGTRTEMREARSTTQ